MQAQNPIAPLAAALKDSFLKWLGQGDAPRSIRHANRVSVGACIEAIYCEFESRSTNPLGDTQAEWDKMLGEALAPRYASYYSDQMQDFQDYFYQSLQGDE